MEESQNSPLFGLTIDPASKQYLSEAARWGRFLAIVGFILCGLVVLSLIFTATSGVTLTRYSSNSSLTTNETGMIANSIRVLYVICFILFYFLPCLFLFRWSGKMKIALAANDQENLNSAFQNLKIFFRYLGIVTIIGLALIALGFIFLLLGAGLAGS